MKVKSLGIAILVAQLAAVSGAHPASAGSQDFADLLAARGLIGGAIPDLRAQERIPEPPDGTSVSEIVANLADLNTEAASARLWQETIEGHHLEFQVAKAPAGQTLVQYWVLAPNGGCDMYWSAVYSADGRLVTADFWRNDREGLKIPGANDFPPDLYPSFGEPISSFFSSLDASKSGATGYMNVQTGPYDSVVLDTWVAGSEELDLPVGKFEAVSIVMRPNVNSVFKTWPSIFRQMALPFMPKDHFWFNTRPPHQLLKFEGTIGYPAPKLNAHLLRTYVAKSTKKMADSRANL